MADNPVPVSTLKCVCKLRHVPKEDKDWMVVRSVEPMKDLMRAVIATDERERAASDMLAKAKLEQETEQYLAGQQYVFPTSPTLGMGDLGEEL